MHIITSYEYFLFKFVQTNSLSFRAFLTFLGFLFIFLNFQEKLYFFQELLWTFAKIPT